MTQQGAWEALERRAIESVRYAGLVNDRREAEELAGIASVLAWEERFSKVARPSGTNVMTG